MSRQETDWLTDLLAGMAKLVINFLHCIFNN